MGASTTRPPAGSGLVYPLCTDTTEQTVLILCQCLYSLLIICVFMNLSKRLSFICGDQTALTYCIYETMMSNDIGPWFFVVMAFTVGYGLAL